MPRSAANRKFGYRADAIVRILTAADAEEVLKALRLLDLDPTRGEDEADAYLIIGGIALNLVTPFFELVDMATDVLSLSETMEDFTAPAHPGGHAEIDAWARQVKKMTANLRKKAGNSHELVTNVRKGFLTSMKNVAEAYPDIKPPLNPMAFQE